MELEFITLADSVATAENKLYIHGGALTQVHVPHLPWPFQVGVAGRFLADEGELGNEHTVSVAVIQPDGDPVFPMQPIPVTLGNQHRVTDDSSSLAVLISLQIGPIALYETGWYFVDIGLDRESVASLPLRVSVRPQLG